MSKEDPIESGKRAAAYAAVDEYVRDGMKLGVGSGSTIVYAVERLAQRVKEEGLHVLCVPTGFQSRQLLLEHGLEASDLTKTFELDVAIDGADEVDEKLNLIKGGGGCQLQEKMVASAASRFVVIADERKDSKRLGEKWTQGVPIEVIPAAFALVESKLKKLGLAPKLRMAVKKAGPVVTDNGNLLIDAKHGPLAPSEVAELNRKVSEIAGVVETGFFVGMAEKAFFGAADGSVIVRTA